MASAASACFFLLTITNIFINLYFHSVAETYRNSKILPIWAQEVRNYFETADMIIKPYDMKEIDISISEKTATEKEAKEINEKLFKNSESLKYLQLDTLSNNKYDLRDDFEFKKSLKKTDITPEEMELNEHRLSIMAENRQDEDLNDLVEISLKDEDGNNKKEEGNDDNIIEQFQEIYENVKLCGGHLLAFYNRFCGWIDLLKKPLTIQPMGNDNLLELISDLNPPDSSDTNMKLDLS